MNRFRQDNTEGYSAAQLAILNEEFDLRASEVEDYLDTLSDLERKSHLDHIAENVQSEFDTTTKANDGYADYWLT